MATYRDMIWRYRALLVFSVYVATVGGGWFLGLTLPRYFPRNQIAALVGETALVFFMALLAGIIRGLIARRTRWPVDGFFAFLMAWLSFGGLCGASFCMGRLRL